MAGDGWGAGESAAGGKKADHNPADRGKLGTKRSVLTDGNGIPLALIIAPANRHDMKLFETTLEARPVVPADTEEDEERPLCLDRGYNYDEVRCTLERWGYQRHIPPQDERDLVIHDSSQLLSQTVGGEKDALMNEPISASTDSLGEEARELFGHVAACQRLHHIPLS